MSRQKPRPGSDPASDPAHAEKVRARQRLIGAVVLCVAAAIIVPMLLESEPRTGLRSLPMTVSDAAESTHADQPWLTPPADDTPSAPDRVMMLDEGSRGPKLAPGQPSPQAPGDMPGTRLPPDDADAMAEADAAAGAAAASRMPPAAQPGRPGAQPTTRNAAPGAQGQPPAGARPGTPAQPTQPRTQPGQQLPKPLPMAQGRQQQAPAERPDVLARLIDQVDAPPGKGGRNTPSASQQRRFLVQVGAYSSVKSARAAVDKVGKAGFSAYQETVKSGNADWIRVRVGPFGSREDAERAVQALRQAGITAAMIAL